MFAPEILSALRLLSRRRTGIPTLVVAIALSVGSASAAWAIYAVVSDGLPGLGSGADPLVQVWDTHASGDGRMIRASDAGVLHQASLTIAQIATYASVEMTIEGTDHVTRRLRGAVVSSEFFEIADFHFRVGVPASFRMSEAGAETPMVVSARLQRIMPIHVGDTVQVDGGRGRVVAIVDAQSWFPTRDELYWIPLVDRAAEEHPRSSGTTSVYVQAVARLRPGVPLVGAPGAIDRELSRAAGTFRIEAYGSELRQTILPSLVAVQAAAIFLLAVGGVNAAWIFSMRASSLTLEFQLMTALGASPARLFRLVAMEAVAIGAIAAPCAVVVCWALLAVFMQHDHGTIGRLADVRLTPSVAALAFVASVMISLASSGRAAARAARGPRKRHNASAGRTLKLEVGLWIQVVLVVALGTQAVLQTQSLSFLTGAEYLGFDSHDVLVTRATLAPGRALAGDVTQRYRALAQRLGADRDALGLVSNLPLSGYDRSMSLRIPGTDLTKYVQVGMRIASPEYFSLLRMRFLAGRPFVADRQRTIVVNSILARTLLGQPDVVGWRIILGGMSDPEWEIVGVVQPAKHGDVLADTRPEVFVAYEHADGFVDSVRTQHLSTVFLVFRSDDAVVTREIIDRTVPESLPGFAVGLTRSYDDLVGGAAGPRPVLAFGAGVFATIALALMGAGFYGVAGQTLLKRSRELAIRSALGASWMRGVFELVRPILLALVAGLPIGVLIAMGTARGFHALVPSPPGFNVTTSLMAAVSAVVLSVVAGVFVALILPAYRARRVDTVLSLRR